MGKVKKSALAAVVVAAVLSVSLLAGCSSSSTEAANSSLTESSQYMAKMNGYVEELETEFSEFSAAAASFDLVSMSTQMDDVSAIITKITDLEVPSNLAEVGQAYKEGCTTLKDALTMFVQLYNDVTTATEDDPFDYSTFPTRLSEIQSKYDAGIAKLQEADEKAASIS